MLSETGDFITDFVAYTKSALSPDIFRLWSGIALVAGAVERRVFLRSGRLTAYPSLYTLLVGPPGIGKYIIEEARGLWQDTLSLDQTRPAFHVAPDSVTKAALVDSLGRSTRTFIPEGAAAAVTHSSLLVAAEEFAVLMPAYDMEFIGTLNAIYNNKKEHVEHRRTGQVRELIIPYPQLNILGGTQPGWLASVFPEEAWTTGLTSRMIMIYCAETPYKDIFDHHGDQDKEREALLERLSRFSAMYGEMVWEPKAMALIREWMRDGEEPVPMHSKLESYRARRKLHLTKLAMVSALSRTEGYEVGEIDVRRAQAWLFAAEERMPDIFRAMVGRSDHDVLEELHRFLMQTWVKNNREPVQERFLLAFLARRVPTEKIMRLMDVAEKGGYMARIAGEQPATFKPLPRLGAGEE